MAKKTLEISLPQIRLKDLYSLKAILALLFAIAAAAGYYWHKEVYPYYRIKHAKIYTPIKEVKAEEMGFLAEATLNEGDLFRKGESLFSLDGALNASLLNQIEEKIKLVQSQIQETGDKASQIMDQYLYLQKELEGVSSSEVMEEILAEVQDWQERNTELQHELSLLETERTVIQDKLSRLFAVASFEGVVLRRFISPGENLKEGDAVLLVGLKDLSIEADLPETMLSKISLNQDATIRIPAFPGKTWQGHISWISPTVLEGKLKIRIKADDLPFKSGLSADVSIRIR